MWDIGNPLATSSEASTGRGVSGGILQVMADPGGDCTVVDATTVSK